MTASVSPRHTHTYTPEKKNETPCLCFSSPEAQKSVICSRYKNTHDVFTSGWQTDSTAALPAAHREFAGLFVLTKAFIAKVQKLTSFDCREDRRGGGTGRELALWNSLFSQSNEPATVFQLRGEWNWEDWMRLQNEVLLRLTLSSSLFFCFRFCSFWTMPPHWCWLSHSPRRCTSSASHVWIGSSGLLYSGKVSLVVLFYPPWRDDVIDPAKSHRRYSFKPCQCLRILFTNSEHRRRPY